MSQTSFTPTQRTKIERLPQRGEYDRAHIYQILDEGSICHVSFAIDNQPYVIPTAYGRIEDTLYIHGSPASRMLRTLQQGVDVCVNVTLLDGLVLARSAFHHSMNYRSVVVFGTVTTVSDPEAKLAALYAFTEQIILGRWAEVRSPTMPEIAGTLVLSLPLTEASAKVRTGAPNDDEADYQLPVWAGELPLQLIASTPIADPRLQLGIELPASVQNYARNIRHC